MKIKTNTQNINTQIQRNNIRKKVGIVGYKDTKILVREYTKSSVHYYTRQLSAHMKI